MPWKDMLTFAVHIKDHPTALRLLNEGQSPDGLTNGHQSLLHIAVQNNDLQMTSLLLDHGADVNKQDDKRQTALFESTSPDVNVEIAKILLDAGGTINVQDMYERTPLHYLSYFPQEVKMTHFLCAPSLELLNAVDYFGNTALHLCTQSGQRHRSGSLSVMDALLTAGADPNIQDSKGRTALHHVSTQYRPDTKLFLGKARDVDYLLLDDESDNFMHKLMANRDAMQPYLKDLFESSVISKPHWKVLLNKRNVHGLSPFGMYFETFLCSDKVVSKMIELGADINMPDGLGVTPLMKSSSFSLAVTKTLLQHGADPNAQDLSGRTAIHLAMSSDIASLLIEAGANVNLCDKWGHSPLQQSIYSDQEMLTEIDVQATLIMHGADINHQDRYGATALHHAAYDNSEIASCLLTKGADRRIQDKSGRTPLDVARHFGNECSEQILQQNSTISHSDEKVLKYPDDITKHNLQKHLSVSELPKSVGKACDDLLQYREGNCINDIQAANQNIKTGVTSLMEAIANKVGEQDEKFSIQMYSSGSLSEGTKTGLYNEFDFVYCLGYFADLCDIVEDRPDAFSGLARLKCKTILPPREVAHFFDDEGFLLSFELRKACDSLIKRIILNEGIWKIDNIMMGGLDISFAMNDTEKPVINFTISWIDDLHRKLDISIDVAFAIRKAGWWPLGIDAEKIPLMTEEVKIMGCLLLVQVPEHMKWEGQLFRISCSLSESCVMAKLPKHVKYSYKLAKILKDVICPEIDFGDDEDGTPSLTTSAADAISSYTLKNCLFHVIAKGDIVRDPQPNESMETRKRYVMNSTVEIYRHLMMTSNEQILPCHFLPRVDLFRYKTVNLEGFEEDMNFFLDLKKTTDIICSYCKVILGCLGIFDD